MFFITFIYRYLFTFTEDILQIFYSFLTLFAARHTFAPAFARFSPPTRRRPLFGAAIFTRRIRGKRWRPPMPSRHYRRG